jgi:hypothetical protein
LFLPFCDIFTICCTKKAVSVKFYLFCCLWPERHDLRLERCFFASGVSCSCLFTFCRAEKIVDINLISCL